MTSHQPLSLSTPGIIQCAALAQPDQDLHTHNTPDLPVDIVITATIMGPVRSQPGEMIIISSLNPQITTPATGIIKLTADIKVIYYGYWLVISYM